MGLIAKITEISSGEITEVSADLGGNNIVTAEHVSSPGDDSQPLPTDYVALSAAAGTGRKTAVGYWDAKNAGIAGPGEKRIYSRNSAGEIQAEAYLKNDGSVELKNSRADITLDPSGKITIHSSNGEVEVNSDGPTGKVVVNSTNVYLGDELTAIGVVTAACSCAYTGALHPVASQHVKATL